MKFEISCIEYTVENGDPVLHLFGRDKKGEKYHVKVYGFKPFFYVDREEFNTKSLPDHIVSKISKVESTKFRSIDGRRLYRVYTRVPKDVPEVRKFFEWHGEADIPFPTRYLISKGIKSGVEISNGKIKPIDYEGKHCIWYLDIETAGLEAWLGNVPICLISFFDSIKDKFYSLYYHPSFSKTKILKRKVKTVLDEEKEHVIALFPDEKMMLEFFVKTVKKFDPDIITGWNVKRFDLLTILRRMEKLGIDINELSPIGRVVIVDDEKGRCRELMIRGRTVLELIGAYKRVRRLELESYRLDDVAEEELGVKKLIHATYTELIEIWKKNPWRFLDYNIRDVDLIRALDEKLSLIEFFLNVKRISGCELSDAEYPGRVVDRLLLFEAWKNKIVLPSRPKNREDEKKSKYKGALTLKPKPGIYKYVGFFDLASAYVNIFLSFNIGIDTLTSGGEDVIKTPIEGVFFKKKESIVAGMLRKLVERRSFLKKLRDKYHPDTFEYKKYHRLQHALKVVALSVYGVLGWSSFRLFNKKVAETVTAICRDCLKKVIEIIENSGFQVSVIYGDTDGVFVDFSNYENLEKVIEDGRKIEELINVNLAKYLIEKYNVENPTIYTKFERIWSPFLIGETKKRYVGRLVFEDNKIIEPPSIMWRGFEFRRSDSARITKKVQRDLVEIIFSHALYTPSFKKEMRKKVLSYLQNLAREFRKLPLEEIAIPKGISKDVEKYERLPAHVRGFEYAVKVLKLPYPVGEKVKYIYIREVPKGYPRTDVLSFVHDYEVPEGFVPDYEKMFELTVLSKIEPFIKVIGIDPREIRILDRSLLEFM